MCPVSFGFLEKEGLYIVKKSRPYRGKTFYKLMAAFFVVTMLCSILVLIQYFSSIRIQREEEILSYRAMSEKSVDNTAVMLSHYEEASVLISHLDGFEELANAAEIPLDSPLAEAFIPSYVNTVRLNMPSTEQPMYLYFEKSGRVFGKSAGSDPLESGTITGLFGLNMETWESLIQTGEEGICTIIHDPNMDFARFMYVRQISPGVVWMIGMEDGQISENLSYYYLPDGSLTVFVTENNQKISSNLYEGGEAPPLTFEQVSSWAPYSTQTLNGQPYFVYHQGFTNNTLQQVILIPDTNGADGVSLALSAIFTTLAVSLLLGGLLSYFFSTKLYRPVEKMVDALPMKRSGKEGSEFQMVANTVQALSEKARAYEAQLSSQADLLAADLTLRLFHGEIGMTPDISEALRQGGVPILCERFLVFILSIDEDADAQEPHITQEAAGSLLKETCRSFFLNGGLFAYVVTDRDLYIGLADLDGKNTVSARECAEQIQQFTASELHLQVSIALSGEHEMQSGDFLTAYQEAMQVVEYYLLTGEYGKIGEYSRLSGLIAGNTGSREFLARVNKLSNAIQSGNYAQASVFLQDVEDVYTRHPAGLPQAQIQISYLTDAMLLSLLDSGADPELLKSLKCSETLRQARGMDSLCRRARAIFSQLDTLKEPNHPQERRIEQITQYIEDHYQDINLSAGAVAEHFHMSLPVLSNLFKQELNVGFLDYLHRYRIEHAKDLIIHTDHTIGDISAMVGYANSITMNRAFKRYEGVTPGWYRASRTEEKPQK